VCKEKIAWKRILVSFKLAMIITLSLTFGNLPYERAEAMDFSSHERVVPTLPSTIPPKSSSTSFVAEAFTPVNPSNPSRSRGSETVNAKKPNTNTLFKGIPKTTNSRWKGGNGGGGNGGSGNVEDDNLKFIHKNPSDSEGISHSDRHSNRHKNQDQCKLEKDEFDQDEEQLKEDQLIQETSVINRLDDYNSLKKHAQKTMKNQDINRDINCMIKKLRSGYRDKNLIYIHGTDGVYEYKNKGSAARLYIRAKYDIVHLVGISDKDNQDHVINQLRRHYKK
jgi:hypothetical protein